MLRCFLEDSQGTMHSLSTLTKLKISCSKNVPAHSLRLVTSALDDREFLRVHLFEEDECILSALVDEQIISVGENSCTELICRSTAAVLLDNEAKSANFVNPCTELIFKAYAQPYGFSEYKGKDMYLAGEFVVGNGMSCYQVLERFSKGAYGKSIDIDGDKVCFEAEDEKQPLYFSNDSEGISFTEFSYSEFPCRRISKIFVKTESQGDYDTVVADEVAVEKGIVRERYMDVSDISDKSLIEAQEAITDAKKSSQEINIVCPLRLLGVLSAQVSVRVGEKLYEGFEVKSLSYTLSGDREETRLTLTGKEI